ncbi:hypothetical protein Tco_0375890 [Tanacetum coccineum]
MKNGRSLLEPTSNKLMVDPTLILEILSRRFFVRLNLPDHRSVLTGSGGSSRDGDGDTSFRNSNIRNSSQFDHIKAKGTSRTTNIQAFTIKKGMSKPVQMSQAQDSERPQTDDQRLDLADDLKEAQDHISHSITSHKTKITTSKYKILLIPRVNSNHGFLGVDSGGGIPSGVASSDFTSHYKIGILIQQYEKFSISSEETIDIGFTRFNAIVTNLKSLDKDYSNKNHVRKFLRDLPLKWRAKVTTIEEAKDLAKLPLDKAYETLKEVIKDVDIEKAEAFINCKELSENTSKKAIDSATTNMSEEDAYITRKSKGVKDKDKSKVATIARKKVTS